MTYEIRDLADGRSYPLVVVDTRTDHIKKYFAYANRPQAERYAAERDAIDAIPRDRRPTSQEVAETCVRFGIDSEAYRLILSCHFGSCLAHAAHEPEGEAMPDLDPLDVGEKVRVFKTHAAGTLWLYDPETGQPAENGYVREGHADGVIREADPAIWPAGVYRVTVVRDDRELYVDWMARHWIRRPDEPEPEGWQRVFKEDELPQ